MIKVMLWPDIYREHGHWLPAVSLAKTLLDQEMQVDFMGIPDTLSIVEPYLDGISSFYPILEDIYAVGHTVNDRLEPIGQRWKPHHLLPMCRGRADLNSLFGGATPPDLLVAGYFAGLEALILHHKYGVRLATLTTFLRHPDEDPAIFARGKLVYMPDALSRKIIELSTGNAEMSLDDFVAPLERAPEMIPCAREFDFYDNDWVHGSNVTYVEPMIERAPFSGTELPTNPPPAPDGSDPIYHTIPSDGTPLIFATAGSQVADYEDQARVFFEHLIAMMKTAGLENYHLVLAVGDKLLQKFRIQYGIDKNAGNNSLPSNVTIAAWVSQLDILTAAKVVFMHGGLATVKESIWEQVPIVILPLGKDQNENALRIRRAGIGITPDVQQVDAQTLRKFMLQATTSKWVARNLRKMKDHFAAAEGADPKPSVAVIQAALQVPVG